MKERSPVWVGFTIVALVAPLFGCKLVDELRSSSSTQASSAASVQPLAVASAALAAGPSSEKEVRFSRRVPKKDQIIMSENAMELTMSITVKQGDKVLSEANLRQSENEKKKMTVLSADDWSISRVRSEYLDKSSSESADGGEVKKQISVVSGKTYIVAAKDGSLDVTDADGDAVTKKELEEVKKDHDDLGKSNKMAELLPDRPITIGEKLTPPPGVIRAIMNGGDDSMEIRDVSLTLKSVEGAGASRVGVFDLTMSVGGAKKPGSPPIEMNLSGPLKLLVNSTWPLELNLTGPITMSTTEQGASVRVKGQGKFSAKSSVQ